VGFKAFWPVLSDYTVDGWAMSFRPLLNVSDADMVPATKEPDIPMVIGEWDFMLGKGNPEQFRGVEVVGLTDYHDADDPQLGGQAKLDREVQYQLDEVFRPWDLNDAVYKYTWRWVEFVTVDETGNVTLANYPVVDIPDELWDQYCVFSERVIDLTENELEARVGYNWRGQDTYTITVDPDTGVATISGLDKGHDYKILYSTYNPYYLWWGRYEWIVVGRDAHSVDSAGAAMVSAAFKNKIIWERAGAEIGLAGADMYNAEVANQMPWVMHKFGTANTKDDYKDNLGRAALRDDWCRAGTVEGDEVPVASSNMIGVGGPLANVLAYYGNDFTPAFYGLPEYACEDWASKIIALSCWSQNTYASNETVGYAVVSTYKDLNGTVLFLIWGHWGRDTYWATYWFYYSGIWMLQKFPDCATALILQITYENTTEGYKPTDFSVVEVLGTISEFSPHPDP
jgi:hypothetical protein